MSVFHSQYITDLLWIMPAHQEPACAAMLIVWSSLRIDQTQTTFFVTLPTKIPLVFLFSSCIWGVPLCSWKKMNCGFIGRLHNIPPPLSLSLSLSVCLRFSVTWCLLSSCFTFRWSLFAFVFYSISALTSSPLSLLSNSIHERCTLHHSVSLYLCLPFIFSTPFCTRERWKEGGGDGWEGERNRERERREGEMDRLGDSDKRSISRPNCPGRIPPPLPSPHLHSILLFSTPRSSSLASLPLTFVLFKLTGVH